MAENEILSLKRKVADLEQELKELRRIHRCPANTRSPDLASVLGVFSTGQYSTDSRSPKPQEQLLTPHHSPPLDTHPQTAFLRGGEVLFPILSSGHDCHKTIRQINRSPTPPDSPRIASLGGSQAAGDETTHLDCEGPPIPGSPILDDGNQSCNPLSKSSPEPIVSFLKACASSTSVVSSKSYEDRILGILGHLSHANPYVIVPDAKPGEAAKSFAHFTKLSQRTRLDSCLEKFRDLVLFSLCKAIRHETDVYDEVMKIGKRSRLALGRIQKRVDWVDNLICKLDERDRDRMTELIFVAKPPQTLFDQDPNNFIQQVAEARFIHGHPENGAEDDGLGHTKTLESSGVWCIPGMVYTIAPLVNLDVLCATTGYTKIQIKEAAAGYRRILTKSDILQADHFPEQMQAPYIEGRSMDGEAGQDMLGNEIGSCIVEPEHLDLAIHFDYWDMPPATSMPEFCDDWA